MRITAVFSISHVPATSCVAKSSGRNTDLIPWVNHLSGNNAANCCIQVGRDVKTKKTPLKNCKIITMGETTADAPRPLFGTTENAIPKTVEQALPRITNQVKFHQRFGEVGRFKPNIKVPKKSSKAV